MDGHPIKDVILSQILTLIRNNPLPERKRERERLGDDKRYFIPISAKILTLEFNIIPGMPSMKN